MFSNHPFCFGTFTYVKNVKTDEYKCHLNYVFHCMDFRLRAAAKKDFDFNSSSCFFISLSLSLSKCLSHTDIHKLFSVFISFQSSWECPVSDQPLFVTPDHGETLSLCCDTEGLTLSLSSGVSTRDLSEIGHRSSALHHCLPFLDGAVIFSPC